LRLRKYIAHVQTNVNKRVKPLKLNLTETNVHVKHVLAYSQSKSEPKFGGLNTRLYKGVNAPILFKSHSPPPG